MKVIKSPVKAIRAFCLDCVGDNRAEVRRCSAGVQGCPLWPFRFVRNPFNKLAKPRDGQDTKVDP